MSMFVCHCHLIHDLGSAYYDDFGGGFVHLEVIIKCRSRIIDQVAMAMTEKLIVNVLTFN